MTSYVVPPNLTTTTILNRRKMITGLLAEVLRDAGFDPSTLSHRGNLIDTPSGPLFAKTARGSSAQVRGEAASLAAMRLTAPEGLVPRCWSKSQDGQTAMACEYARGGGERRMRELGEARMHSVPKDHGCSLESISIV